MRTFLSSIRITGMLGLAVGLVCGFLFPELPLYAMGRKPKLFQVEMSVDFGPAGKPSHREMIYVENGTTPKEAVSQVFPVLSGKACCSFRDVIEIGGVRIDPAGNRWWICRLNGSTDVSPAREKLKSGDKVEWKYYEEAQ